MNGNRSPDRREFLTMGVGLLFVASVPVIGRRGRTGLVRRTVPMMGTTAEIVAAHPDGRYAQRAIDAALRELAGVERAMSRFRTDSDIGRANAFAAAGPVRVGASTTDVLLRARDWAEHTDGRFDPCLGRVSTLWDVVGRSLPARRAEYERFRGARLFEGLDVRMDADAGIVRFSGNDIGLDLGGIAKGYGVDRAVAVLRDWGVRNALVGVGGDLYAMGLRPDGDPWHIGVRSAHDPNAIAVTLEASDQAVATSGDYERYFDHAGRRYHHILDPATAEPVNGPRHSLTVSATDCVSADAAATALFGVPEADVASVVRACADSGVRVLHHIPVGASPITRETE